MWKSIPYSSTLVFISFLFFTLSLPKDSLGQKPLFELAVEIDSLFNELRNKGSQDAKPFFDAFRKVDVFYGDSEFWSLTYELSDLNLTAEIDYAKNLYEASSSEINPYLQYSIKIDSLYNKFEALSGVNKEILQDFKISGDSFSSAIEIYGNESAKNRANLDTLSQLTKEIFDAELELQELVAEKSKYNLSQTNRVIDMLPINTDRTSSISTSIVIQNQVGGSSQSAIIDGTARWIAERMRQELSIAFFEKFEAWADKKNISGLFPNTISVLKTSATTDYTLMIEIYKRAFEKDLYSLTFNIPSFLEKEIINDSEHDGLLTDLQNTNYKIAQRDLYNGVFEEFEYTLESRDSTTLQLLEKREMLQDQLNKKQLLRYLSFSLQTIKQLKEGQHPSALIHSLYNQSPELFPHNHNLESILLLLDVVSQSIMSTNSDSNTVWMGQKAIDELRENTQLRNFYFALIALKVKAINKRNINRKSERLRIEKSKYYAQQSEIDLSTVQELYQGFNYHIGNQIQGVFEDNTDVNWSIIKAELLAGFYIEDELLVDSTQIYSVLDELLETYMNSQAGQWIAHANKLAFDDLALRDSIQAILPPDFIFEDYYILFPNADMYHTITATITNQNFFYHCIREDTYDDAKSAYLEAINYDSNLTRIFTMENISLLNIDAINRYYDQNLEERYAFYQRWLSGDKLFDYGMEYQIMDIALNSIIKDDVYRFIEDMDDNLPTQSILDKQLEISELYKQQRFLNNFILSPDGNKNIGHLLSDFVQYANKIDQINAQFKELRSKGEVNFGNQEFIYLIKNSLSILDVIFDYTVDGTSAEMANRMNMIQFATNSLLDSYIAGLNKDYNGVVMNIIPVVDRLINNKYDKQISDLESTKNNALTSKQIEKGYLIEDDDLRKLRDERDNKLRKMQELFKYCTFIAAVASSDGSEEVKKAINAIALPVGSYGIKRRSYFNVSLNAYPGITGGAEFLNDNTISGEWAPNFGFTAPIGIGFNWGLRSEIDKKKYNRKEKYRKKVQKQNLGTDDKYFNGHSSSIYFSFIDLGALVLFRLQDEFSPLPDNVGFKQIFSPGVSYVHGLPGSPISLMLGAQMTPELRKIGEETTANSFRFNFSLVVDLPIVNLYTRNRPK